MPASSPFDYFDAIYCLTTEERTTQYESAMDAFAAIGIADRVTRFNGSDIDRLYVGDRPKNKKTIHVLASLSHLAIWKIAAKKNLSNVLIFEDDVAFSNWDDQALQNAISKLKQQQWELFYLGYNLFGETISYTEIDTHLIELSSGTDIRSTHAYCLSRSGYSKALDYDPINAKVVDQWLPRQLKSHCLVPLMSVQNQQIKERQKSEIFLQNFRKINPP